MCPINLPSSEFNFGRNWGWVPSWVPIFGTKGQWLELRVSLGFLLELLQVVHMIGEKTSPEKSEGFLGFSLGFLLGFLRVSSVCAGELPQVVHMTVEETSPYLRGETAAPSYKPAVLENGVKVMLPPFVKVGDKVAIDTRDGSFLRRV